MIEECAEIGVSGAVIISAGFRETGAHGVELERRVLATARRANMRLIGPNCLGVMCPDQWIECYLCSHDCACRARLRSSARVAPFVPLCWIGACENKSASARFFPLARCWTSVGVRLIDYLGNDPHTHSIVIYMESVGDARSFLSAAREVALTKPILVIKAGRTESAAKAAASHTGTLAGSDAVLDAAFPQSRRVAH